MGDAINWMSYQKGFGGCHTEKVMLNIIPKCNWILHIYTNTSCWDAAVIEYNKYILLHYVECHTKWVILNVIPKGSYWMLYQKGHIECHTKRVILSVIPKGS